MSKENTSIALEEVIDQLENSILENKRTRAQNYQIVQNCLEKDVADTPSIERILKVCVHDMKEDVKYTSIIINVISIILKKIKAGEYVKIPVLVPSALAIIDMIVTLSSLNNVTTLKTMCVETLLLFPDKTLVNVAMTHSEVLNDMFSIPGQTKPQLEFRVLTYDVLYKLLMILSLEEKREFVKEGMCVWFSKIIPTVIFTYTNNGTSNNLKPISVLELLADVIVTMNYTDSPEWVSVLVSICNPNKYPQAMKILLENGNPVWYRLWIVFIKLLKNQITNASSVGTPINSMLPVVEMAFKMDATNRCKAFQCWSVLIESFSRETNENCIMKRLKLLVIPLRLNNAKVEETAMAKFEAWWLLITKFQTKLDKFIDVVMVSFLHFCFGKHNSSGKTSFIPGQLSAYLKSRGIQAFVEIVGHVNCEGCTDLPRLKDRLLNTKYLIDYWKDWVHSMKTALNYSLEKGKKQHVMCLWNSFLLTIAKLPDSNVKRGILNELLFILQSALQDSANENVYDEMVLDLTVTSLFQEELKLTPLLKPKDDEEYGPLNVIISVVSNPLLKNVYERYTMQETIEKLKPLSNFIVFESPKCKTIKKMLYSLPSNDAALRLWTTLGELLHDANDEICPKDLCHLLLWPLKSTNMFADVKYTAKTWYKVYDTNFLKLSKTDIDKDISNLLLSCNIVIHSSIYFTLCATIAILKNGLSIQHSSEYEKEAELLRILLNRVDNYESIEEIFPLLIDTLVVMLNNVKGTVNEKFTETTLMSVKIILKLIVPVLNKQSDISNIINLFRMLLKSVELIFDVESYSKFYYIVVDTLKQDYVPFGDQLLVKDVIQSILNKKTIKEKENINVVQDSIDLTLDNVASDTDLNKNKFTTPNVKDVPKRSKKKETSIVNTVVENGEEFVVVKSNWKFNPRKLTENQKEKLQRKREDIPALYQDLSQSQDEFKMTVWKTDSQDNSTSSKSNSRSTNEGTNTSDILKKLNSADVVPKIMENILSEKDTKEINDKVDEHCDVSTAPKESPKQLATLTPKNKKTPRMALKDRVFKNVRNLIEKSTTPGSSKNISNAEVEGIVKTPLSKLKDCGNVVNSAPSSLLCDRPARVKRKPRKFDDTELFIAKKRCHSQSDSTTDENMEINHPKDNVEIFENSGDKENTSMLTEDNIANCQENLDDAKVIETVTALEEPICNETRIDDKIMSQSVEENIGVADNNMLKVEEPVSEGKDKVNNGDNNKEKLEPDKESSTTIAANECKEIDSPKIKPVENGQQTPSLRKSSVKKSRIEKELAIDMVQGHPFLNTPSTSEKRKTRKNLSSPVNCLRQKKLSDKFNKSKSDPKTPLTADKKDKSELKKTSPDGVHKTDDKIVSSPETLPVSEESCSEDIIESSQDSTITTISVMKKTPKRLPVVSLEKLKVNVSNEKSNISTQNLVCEDTLNKVSDSRAENIGLGEEETVISKQITDKCEKHEETKQMNVTNVMDTQEIGGEIISSENLHITSNADCTYVSSDSLMHQESKDDTELPRNKTALDDKNEFDCTGNMDTQSIVVQDTCEDVIMIIDDEQPVVSVSSDENVVSTQTQELADADTQPNETTVLYAKIDENATHISEETAEKQEDEQNSTNDMRLHVTDNSVPNLDTMNDTSLANIDKPSDVSSPFKDDAQRKQDFLNNTIEISPIKTVSPEREKKSPSPDRSNDYVVIKLTSPVQSNGEPFEKGSPEFFTEDKISPDKRDQSPPRSEITVTNTSPSSSLSLKKNRPQVRSGGRAAQMLGLCVPDKLNPLMISDRQEVDEGRKNTPSNTPARRNLRILYNSVGDTSDNVLDNEDSETFLKLKKPLPSVNSSPSGPILKRKLAEITDEGTISPANKRKRVSFHDPPVSTTVTVQKYIEPCGVRSPQNSAQKRQERQARMQNNLKSPKRLDNLFSLESVLTKTVESFTDVDLSLTDDTQMTPLDQTPSAEIVTTSELNNTDPICPELLDCKDVIGNIASELSSPAMKELLIKELEGKIETIGDLAKMTELEVNRLCIKAPKIKVVKKVLSDYAANMKCKEVIEIIDDAIDVGVVIPPQELKSSEIAIQTNEIVSTDAEMQTFDVALTIVSTQTDEASTSSVSAQTDESGSRTTAEIIQTCLAEKPDFVCQLSEQLEESSVQQIAKKMSFEAVTNTLMSNIDQNKSKIVLERLLSHESLQETNEQNSNKQLAFLRDYLCDKFESKDLMLFCSDLLKKMYDKPA